MRPALPAIALVAAAVSVLFAACTSDAEGPLEGGCRVDADCSDGVFCNGEEICAAGGICRAGEQACDDGIECTRDHCFEEVDRCANRPEHTRCDDNDACTGQELCNPLAGCEAGTPLVCEDFNDCTVDLCDADLGCQFRVLDQDGDGFFDAECGGDDCDDSRVDGLTAFPGAPEICGNFRDDDCDGAQDFFDNTCFATNDDCGSAYVIRQSGTYTGNTLRLSPDLVPSCVVPAVPITDAVYKLVVDAVQDVYIRVRELGAGGIGALSIRPFAACWTGPELGCATGTAGGELLMRALPAGEYAIVISASNFFYFAMDVEMTAPVPQPIVDECVGAAATITASGEFTGFFSEVDDDYTLTCGAAGTRDAAYKLQLTARKRVRIDADGASGVARKPISLALTTDCSLSASEVSCVRSGTTDMDPPGTITRTLEPGTYWILLEPVADAVRWDLSVDIRDPDPELRGDSCERPILFEEGRAQADLSTMTLNAPASCRDYTTGSDALFAFDVSAEEAPVDVMIGASRDGGGRVNVVMAGHRVCGEPSGELRCDRAPRTLPGTNDSLRLRNLSAGRYYITIASPIAEGVVTANLRKLPPTTIPANDQCAGALDISGGYAHTDSLWSFADDVMGCAGAGRIDAFYRIVATERSRIVANVVPAEALDTLADLKPGPFLVLRRGCEPDGPDLACMPRGVNRFDNPTDAPAIDVIVDPGTYHLIVEGTPQVGDFRLLVFVGMP